MPWLMRCMHAMTLVQFFSKNSIPLSYSMMTMNNAVYTSSSENDRDSTQPEKPCNPTIYHIFTFIYIGEGRSAEGEEKW